APDVALAFCTASRRLPAPASDVLVTMKVAGCTRSSSNVSPNRRALVRIGRTKRDRLRAQRRGKNTFIAGSSLQKGKGEYKGIDLKTIRHNGVTVGRLC